MRRFMTLVLLSMFALSAQMGLTAERAPTDTAPAGEATIEKAQEVLDKPREGTAADKEDNEPREKADKPSRGRDKERPDGPGVGMRNRR